MDSKQQELEEKFWKSLTSDRTVMLGIDGVEDGHSRPMTAVVEHDGGPIWFFTGKSNGVVENLKNNRRAVAAFSRLQASMSPPSNAASAARAWVARRGARGSAARASTSL